ncbi:hypothetical protein AB0H42_24635 [Nocardia sp. NPDC050799]|uniref:hypothetical protein n=1 Tax=Nocardia sp. NPDC050799 TaxID=3154842 RepID=UPI0033C096DB
MRERHGVPGPRPEGTPRQPGECAVQREHDLHRATRYLAPPDRPRLVDIETEPADYAETARDGAWSGHDVAGIHLVHIAQVQQSFLAHHPTVEPRVPARSGTYTRHHE